MTALGPVTIGCPACGERLPVPCKVVVDLPHTRTVLVRMDYTTAREHFATCVGKPEPTTQAPAKAAPATPRLPAYIAPGTRACTMCGTPSPECMQTLQAKRTGCCPSCTVGDTHPVPRGTMTCAQWGAEHGAQSDAAH